ncbi:phosphomannose isomerase type II C-terminal cupin domain [Arsenicicoccus piscis]|uniref:Mannose-6-phosphate isomerase type II C-terminal domain-containing protein n=1 Tax=Arsenicicoccus piscis TaxID=673954 RepID=A0ABQ6HRS6_9MICO|nr:phosphomannose isomerase type II C-terminal cupin domain [Arsenicicoccus piscis]MCH8629072.1 phosphomannose isomerase type II C-terminal cupin domain [Arsenicicoccus piscis]GMA20378.1 hypothetical protein GCM10025862_23990 [Arsenicicoccus piscis]
MPLDDPRTRVFVAERPWGQFEQFVHNERVTVKIITVLPGRRLSLQRHENRGELWIVLDHAMRVEVGDQEWDAMPGEQVWVPDHTLHRLSNTLSTPCRVMEVAFGPFDEADIERLEDDYARADPEA